MLDKLLALGSTFDWISPLIAAIQDRRNGPHHTFLIPHTCGWSGREIEHMLRRYGVQTWGGMIVKDTIMITVPQSQARWGEYLLEREGVPLLNFAPVADERAALSRRRDETPGDWSPGPDHAKRRSPPRKTLLQELDDLFNELMDVIGL